MMNATSEKSGRFSSFFLRLAGIFLLVLIVLSTICVVVSIRTSQLYYDEINQRLNRGIAGHITSELPAIVGGTVNDSALKELFHNSMVLNPHLEIYLTDTTGKILSYYAPDSIIHLRQLPLAAIRNFIQDTTGKMAMGPDPRHPSHRKAFSAAPVHEDGRLSGYIYVILASEAVESVAQTIMGSYILRLSVRIILITFLVAVIAGLAALWFMTRSYRSLMSVIDRFRTGDFAARMINPGSGSVGILGQTFNDLADRVQQHLDTINTIETRRRHLIAGISHDLRTPIATMQGYVETLLMKTDSLTEEERLRYLNTVHAGTRRMQRLVEDLFELSKLEAQETAMNIEAFSIAEIAQDNLARYQSAAGKKGVRLDMTSTSDLPLVKGDIRYIDRVMQNLVDNAVKYCRPRGQVNVDLCRSENSVRIGISNDGPGIDPQEIPRLFEAYRTGNHQRGRSPDDVDSTGLGLAIVKQILTRHGTEISVSSSIAGPTEFFFLLPVMSRDISSPVLQV